jgi:plastocyanin
MSSTGKVIAAIIIVAVIAGGAVLLSKKSNESTSGDSSTSQSQDGGNASGSSDDGASSANDNGNGSTDVTVTIKYNGTNFTLSSDRMKAGGTVRVINDSQDDLDFDSDPHPVHTDNPELNAGDIAPGESKTFVIDKKGTWGFHNHLDSSQHGQLIVE